MDEARKKLLLQNLAAAGFFAVLAVLVAGVAILAEAGSVRRERESLSALAGRKAQSLPTRFTDPDFSRLYLLEGKGSTRYGTVARLGADGGSVLAALVFTGKGDLEAARIVGEGAAGLPFAKDGWFSEFLGKGASRGFPRTLAELRRSDVASGATRSLDDCAETLGRVSAAVLSAAGRKE